MSENLEAIMMEFYGGDNVNSEPLEVVQRWIEVAEGMNEPEPTAVHLATVDAEGMPDLRVLYIREIDDRGFVFYTNYESAKGQELRSGKAAINYYFPNWGRQMRVRGHVEKVSPEKSDAYFLARPEQSRLGAWMSQQSRPVDNRELMQREMDNLDPKIADQRPDHWGGYRLSPLEIEFWAMGDYRIHDRFRWSRQDLDAPWSVQRLYP